VCATAGNHGRAVARVARDKHVPCTIFVPAARTARGHDVERDARAERIASMRADGATVVEVDGSYEDAVRAAAAYGASSGATIVSDTAWPGYEEIPRWIMAGYTQLFEEAYGTWDRAPDVMLVQGGVGGLVCAAVSWAAWRFGASRPRIIACEPEAAACLLESAEAGRPVSVSGSLDTIMAGLRCAEPSPAAWPAIRDGIDAFVSIPDSIVLETIGQLRMPADADPAMAAGPSGACGVASLTALMRAPELAPLRTRLGLVPGAHAFAVVTEGP
jgi:diaminopropionate ammonia-lyase